MRENVGDSEAIGVAVVDVAGKERAKLKGEIGRWFKADATPVRVQANS